MDERELKGESREQLLVVDILYQGGLLKSSALCLQAWLKAVTQEGGWQEGNARGTGENAGGW